MKVVQGLRIRIRERRIRKNVEEERYKVFATWFVPRIFSFVFTMILI